jgi:hypothetical protein
MLLALLKSALLYHELDDILEIFTVAPIQPDVLALLSRLHSCVKTNDLIDLLLTLRFLFLSYRFVFLKLQAMITF